MASGGSGTDFLAAMVVIKGDQREMIFTVPAILNRISYSGDKGLNLGFITQEISDEEKIKVGRFHKSFGYLLFKESEVLDADIPEGNPSLDEDKSPSQRLRAVLYVLYEQGGKKGSWEDFYRRNMEHAIQRVKALLD